MIVMDDWKRCPHCGARLLNEAAFCPHCAKSIHKRTVVEPPRHIFLKADAVHRQTGRAAVADDSGLCVDALDGRPGVYSARYAGEETPYPEKIQCLLAELDGVPDEKRTARFVAHICYIDEDGQRLDIEESCEGKIGYAPAGENGFGFDPIFLVGEKSFSELDDAEKDAISHRGKALRRLAAYLEKQG